ncbi:DUF1294 domain-containing protein [Thalassotalea profundi]|uniref:DNA-binding protein n=1 Tax=Thalassotalea profundi TaxID=2036687 RepID=A0ABQ3IRY3_9GAMM|nr:DUF1294 domain-containing protein [Thalassotalea profundi]GHE88179.1 DNA-binding protein [Thalassotalea profundi]
MRLKGKLIKWDNDKAFGFIAPNGGGEHVFIHKNAFSNRNRTPNINDIITFSITKDKQGRYCADLATYSGEKLKIRQAKNINQFSIYLSIIFLSGLVFALLFNIISSTVVFYYFGCSMFTYIIYAVDKAKAQRGEWRTSESALHTLALIGGWPGAAVAQQTLRHKSQKKAFRSVFWLTVIINCGVLSWLLSVNGPTL